MIYRTFGKRWLDVAVAIPAVVLGAPVLLLLALLVRAKLGAPVIFRHQRPGLGGAPFILWKFRTMTGARDAAGQLLPDAERAHSFGQLLRRTSLDELPELINVLRGEMSLVGPRPLEMRYLPRYTPEQMRRHEVRPGITGLAQVSGRNELSWDAKFTHDVDYVDRCSLALDLHILWRTVRAVIAREGVSAPDQFSSTEFMGTAASFPKQP